MIDEKGMENEYCHSGEHIGPERIEKEIAYCIPTYNRPDIMEQVLGKFLPILQNKGMDIYIYDSSVNKETLNIVENFIQKGIKNLYYVRIDPGIEVDEKLIMLLSGYGLQYSYNYIWMVKDRCYVEEETLKVILEETKKGYDAIFLSSGYADRPDKEANSIVYLQREKFYADWGWLASSMNCTLFRVESLLAGMDWNEFRDRYFFDGVNLFEHFTVLFHGLAQKESVSVGVICGEVSKFGEINIGEDYWTRERFQVWGKLWMEINNAFPSCYDEYKADVIHRATNLSWLFGSHTQLVKFRKQGTLTEQDYEEMKDRWPLLSSVPKEEFKMIACGQLKECKEAILNRINSLLQEENYQELEKLYWFNSWIREEENSAEYIFFGLCLEIYKYEKEEMSQGNIFYHVWSYQAGIQKVRYISEMLVKLEYNIDQESWDGFKEFVMNNRVSEECLVFLINRCCAEKEQVIDKVADLLEGR